MEIQRPNLAKTKKSRKGAMGIRKVKTGCLTCKIRHKKCDETKPACSQCAGTGRKCEFVSLTPSGSIAKQQNVSQYQHDKLLWTRQEPAAIVPVGDCDTPHFEYFRDVCTKEFSLYFEMPLWETIILQAAWSEPCIWHAALAIGALSRRHYYPAEFQSKSLSTFDYSIEQYNLAIRELNRRLGHSPRSWELAILGSIVFIAIEVLQGQENRVQMHLHNALAMLETLPTSVTYPMTDHDTGFEGGKFTSAKSYTTFTMSSDLGYLASALARLNVQFSSFLALDSEMPTHECMVKTQQKLWGGLVGWTTRVEERNVNNNAS